MRLYLGAQNTAYMLYTGCFKASHTNKIIDYEYTLIASVNYCWCVTCVAHKCVNILPLVALKVSLV